MDFKVGDYVETSEYVGKVIHLHENEIHIDPIYFLRASEMDTDEGMRIDVVHKGSSFWKYELRLLQVKWADFRKLYELLYA